MKGHFLALSIIVMGLSGCQSNAINLDVISNSKYEVPADLVSKHSNVIVTDELENRFYYTGADYNNWILGNTYYKIRYTYQPGSAGDYVMADVRTMQKDWVYAKSVSLYVKSEKLIDNWQDGRYTDTSIVDGGYLGSTVYTHEHFEIKLTMEEARRIAFADAKDITLRFYGDNGYVDEKLHFDVSIMEGLRGVVELAQSTTLK